MQAAASQSRRRVDKPRQRSVAAHLLTSGSKKSRCTGIKPCASCSALGLPCQFTAPYARGKPPTPPGDETPTELSSYPIVGPSTTSGASHNRSPNSAPLISPSVPVTSSPVNLAHPTTESGEPPSSSGTGLEDAGSDEQGHFIGDSSNVSFFSRLQGRASPVSETSIFTSGDAPLPPFNIFSFVFPPKGEATALLNRYFDFGSPTYRYLYKPTVETWLEQVYEPFYCQTPARTAVLLTVFAIAARYATGTAKQTEFHDGVRYFQASEHQLRGEKGTIALENIQARLGQCLFLMTCSRVNHCWDLFGTTSRLIIACGLHRKSSKSRRGQVEEESRRRLFWCAYNLDKYLGAMLGRPCVFHDEDIDQQYPSVVEDAQLAHGNWQPTNGPSRCNMFAPVLHFKLVGIVSRALREMYSVRPPTEARTATLRSRLNEELRAWREVLPAFLDPDQVDPTLLVANFQRQSYMLRLAYSHAVILVNRGSLMNELRKGGPNSDLEGSQEDVNVKACLSAAMSILHDVDQMGQAGKIFPAYWFTHYQAFCAVVFLYTYTIRSAALDHLAWKKSFETAERCQAHIGALAQEGTLAHRYFVVMEEFRLKATAQMKACKAGQTDVVCEPSGNVTLGNVLTDEELLQAMNGIIDPSMSLAGMDLDNWPDMNDMGFGNDNGLHT